MLLNFSPFLAVHFESFQEPKVLVFGPSAHSLLHLIGLGIAVRPFLVLERRRLKFVVSVLHLRTWFFVKYRSFADWTWEQ